MRHRTIQFKKNANRIIEQRTMNTGEFAVVAMPKICELTHINKMDLAKLNEMSEIDKMGVIVRKVRTHSKPGNSRRRMVRVIRSGNTVKEQLTFASHLYKKKSQITGG